TMMVRSNFFISEFWGETRILAGWAGHRFIERDGKWLIQCKQVNLLECDQSLRNPSVLLLLGSPPREVNSIGRKIIYKNPHPCTRIHWSACLFGGLPCGRNFGRLRASGGFSRFWPSLSPSC